MGWKTVHGDLPLLEVGVRSDINAEDFEAGLNTGCGTGNCKGFHVTQRQVVFNPPTVE